MHHHRLIQIVAMAAVLLCLLGGALLGGKVQQKRVDLQLSSAPQLEAGAAPWVKLTASAMGPFRGALANAMWYRAESLKQEGQYAEINELARVITTMQPRFPKVWQYQAWNMAYNISVARDTAEERWYWVRKGIELLRSEGIPQNPDSLLLYRELGWIFFHKVGGYTDDHHWYYKQQLAYEWQEFLGAPTDGATTKQAVEQFREVADAHDTLEELIAERPGVRAILNDHLRPIGYSADEKLLRAIGRILMYNNSPRFRHLRRMRVQFTPPPKHIYDPALAKVLNDTNRDDSRALIRYLQKHTIVHRYHMDPAYMLDLMELKEDDMTDRVGLGPLDWRHPASHGAYWSFLGVMQAIGKVNKDDLDFLNTDRQVIHSCQMLMSAGRVAFDPLSRTIDYLPDTRFIRAYNNALVAAIERVKQGQYPGGVLPNFQTGHENFLRKASAYEYMYGDVTAAQAYRDEAQRLYGHMERNIQSGYYERTLNDTATAWWKDNLQMTESVRQFIDAMVFRAFYRGLLQGRPGVYERCMTMAYEAWEDLKNDTVPTIGEQRRIALRPFSELVANSFARMITSSRFDVLARSQLWYAADPVIQRAVYDTVRPHVEEAAKQAGLNMAIAFPEPSGMEEYRRLNPIKPKPSDPSGLQSK